VSCKVHALILGAPQHGEVGSAPRIFQRVRESLCQVVTLQQGVELAAWTAQHNSGGSSPCE